MRRLTYARLRRSLKARIRGLLSSYYFSNRHFYQKAIRGRAAQRAWRTISTSYPELLEFATPMLEARMKASPGLALAGIKIKCPEVLYLFERVLQWRPRTVLECGAGTSTVALAYGLYKVHVETGVRGHLVSMEENHEYLNGLVIPNFPKALLEYVEFVESPKSFFRYRADGSQVEYEGICYTDVPKLDYDLIYVDGPSYSWVEGKRAFEHVSPEADWSQVREPLFNSDSLNYLLEAHNETRIVVDQRIRTRRTLKEFLHGNYRVRYKFAAMKSEFFVRPQNVRRVHRVPLIKGSFSLPHGST